MPCSRYRPLAEALADPQAISRGEVHNDAGSFLVPNAPYRLSGMDVSVRPSVAALGEHNAEILSEAGWVAPGHVAISRDRQ